MDICRCFHELGNKPNSFNCVNCGAYMFRHRSVQGVKTKRFADSNMMNPQEFINFLRTEAAKFQVSPEVRISGETRAVLERLVEKVGIKDDTFALGLYIFYTLFMREVQSASQQTKYATLCLYEASKAEQSHTGVSLRRFWKYSNNSFEREQYPDIEAYILGRMDFDLQITTFMSFIHFYLINGTVFTNQPCTDVKRVQDRVLNLCHWFISTGFFMLLPPEQLASFILYRSRKDQNVTEVWNWYIEEYTGISVKKVNQLVRHIQGMVVMITTDSTQGHQMGLGQAITALGF